MAAYKERIKLNESKLAFVASDKNLEYKQPVMLKEADLLLRGSEEYYKKGRDTINFSKVVALVGFLFIVILILDFQFNYINLSQKGVNFLLIMAAITDIVAAIIKWIGRRLVYKAYAAIYRRSETYRYAPHIV